MFVIIDLPVPFGVIVISPSVFVDVNALPFNFKLSTFHSSTFLFTSTITLELAVTTPCEWSKRFVKYSPPISIAEFDVEVGSPIKSL